MPETLCRATTCYVTDRGLAYHLWAAVEDERLTRGWTGVEMAKHLGLPRNTIGRLKTSPNKPEVPTVHKIADGLRALGVDIDRRQAERLAGLRPPEAGEPGAVSVREAILRDPIYTDEQRQAMLQLVDIFASANRVAGRDQEREAS